MGEVQGSGDQVNGPLRSGAGGQSVQMADTEPARIPDPNHQNESGQGPRVRSKEVSTWTREEAEDCYGLNRWGEGYFGVSDNGNLTLLPSPDSPAVELQGIERSLGVPDIAKSINCPI